ncbi:lytic transglycosylase domain-containing protein [Acetobacter sicerae]|uniref:lytic transglycosylase domain-containing protein n=1 Tax=Acetobacter sicerae TaxID=85325 RepID=UPI00156B83DF|nr:lytic transglycosylase domain-containing protein [Acetobacter sicerae]NHN93212.1 transglycosylase SLT domain-containing protein [Acetobacter sicerae]
MMRLIAGAGRSDRNASARTWSSFARLCCAGLTASLVVLMHPASAQDIEGMIRQAAERVALPPEWIRAVMQVESGRDSHAISAKGAMGLMQIMPATWQELRRDLALGSNPFDPQDNILAGASYLRLLHDRYGDAGFLAAYNAGPGRYEAHLATGRPLPHETRDYVASVAHLLDRRTFPADGLHESSVSVAREQPNETLFAGHFPHMPQASGDTSEALFVAISMEQAP